MATVIHVTGLDKALRRVKDAPRQIRFAAAAAVNETAKAVQQHTIGTLLPAAFTLRSRGAPWWRPGTRFGFNIKFARRSQPEPFAVLGSRADWLYLQEEGGTKRASRSLAIPQVGTARRTAGSVISRASKPARLMQRKAGFVIQGTRGKLLMTRTGKRRSSVRFWYAFERDADIKPVLRFGSTEGALARRLLPVEFHQALKKALATAK